MNADRNGFDFDEIVAGPALLFVHAGIADRRMWDPQWVALQMRYRLIRVDLRGFGNAPVRTIHGGDEHDVRAVIDQLEIESIALIGASFGANVALDFALTYPERTRALVLAGTLAGMTEPSPALRAIWTATDAALAAGEIEAGLELENRAWVDGPTRRPEQTDPALRAFVTTMNRRVWERAMTEPPPDSTAPPVDRAGRLGEIAVPTLLIEGALDQPDVAASMARLRRGITHAQHVRVPNAAHFPNLEAPEAFNAATLAFLDQAPRD